MGLFGKSFEEQVEAAVGELRTQFAGARALNAQVEGKTVTLSGVVPSLEMKAAIMGAFNAKVESENTFNKIRVDAPAPEAAPEPVAVESANVAPDQAPEEGATERLHEVSKGETLSAISKKYYGTANQYMKIFKANQDVLDDPNIIRPGQKLRIPK